MPNASANVDTVKRTGQLSQDDFLKLLVTQLKLQSPTNPFDSNTMMQQMSQLTSLSASSELEKTVKQLGTQLNSGQLASASQLVGKHVQVPSELSELKADAGLSGSLLLPVDMAQATVTIRDQHDNVVKTIELGPVSKGVIDFKWDGINSTNQIAAPGIYKITAKTAINGEIVPIKTAGLFNVNSVAFDQDENSVMLDLDGVGRVSLNEVVKII